MKYLAPKELADCCPKALNPHPSNPQTRTAVQFSTPRNSQCNLNLIPQIPKNRNRPSGPIEKYAGAEPKIVTPRQIDFPSCDRHQKMIFAASCATRFELPITLVI